ncbi:MAG: T9SS type A sorting domain-containing protein [Bacteroidetes bacterium]|nr:T9SS type A sorting domain-containing protein [Bacteroidota bacterium]
MKKNLLAIFVVLLSGVCFNSILKAGCGLPKPSFSITNSGGLKYYFWANNVWNASPEWLMGNGDTYKGNNFYNTYPQEGKYNVSLVLWDSTKTCSDTFVLQTICVVDLDNMVKRVSRLKYEFNSLNASPNKRQFTWQFGNNDSASGTKVQYTYSQKGLYNTSLRIYDSMLGCFALATKSLVVAPCGNGKLNDSFNLKPSCTDDRTSTLIYSNNSSYASKISAKVFWGDGNSDTVMNRKYAFSLSHTWSSGGLKSSKLIITDTAGCIDTIINSYRVYDTAAGNYDFSFSITTIKLTVEVKTKFKDVSFYSWNFGDSSIGYGTTAFHNYKDTGVYNVCAYYGKTYPEGFCTLKRCSTAIVDLHYVRCDSALQKLAFGFSPLQMYTAPLSWYFSCSLGTRRVINWYFGDGDTVLNSNANNIQHTFSKEGKYYPTAIVTDYKLWCRDTFNFNPICVFDGRYQVTKLNSPYTYELSPFNGPASGRSYKWYIYLNNVQSNPTVDSGNGNTHQFKFPVRANYQSKLWTYDSSFGCGWDWWQIIRVVRCSGMDSAVLQPVCNQNKTVELKVFNNSSYGLNYNATIDWNDGSVNDTAYNRVHDFTKIHTYSTKGYKTSYIYVTDTSGCSDTLQTWGLLADTAFDNKYLGFNVNISGTTVTLSVKDTSKVYFKEFDFGNGVKKTGTISSYTYPSKADTFNVCALFSSKSKIPCTRQICKQVPIAYYPPPVRCKAVFYKYGDSARKFSMFAYNLSTGKRFHWDFGDGDTSNQYAPKHTYPGLGPYRLCITVYDSACSLQFCDTVGFDTSGVMNRSAGFTLNVIDPNALYKKELVKNQLHIYPNPASDKLNIDLPPDFGNMLQIKITSLTGKEVKTMLVKNTGTLVVESDDLSNGFYMVHVKSGDQIAFSKFTVIR